MIKILQLIMQQFTDSDFSDLALAAFFVLAHRQPRSATTDELIKQAANVAERIIVESAEAERKLKKRKQKSNPPV